MLITLADTDNFQDRNFKTHRPFGRDDYLFVLFKSPAYVFVGGEYVDVDKGDCIIFDKHKIQSYFPKQGLIFCHDFIHFNTENKAEEVLISDIPMGKVIKLSSPELITSVLKEIIGQQRYAESKYKSNILDSLAYAFVYRIKNEVEREGTTPDGNHYSDLLNIRNEIYLSPEKSRTVDEICKGIFLSRSHFQHLYKRYFGISFVSDVINARIILAKKLLLNSSLPICDVAEHCGYQSTSHFIRQFGREVGMSPDKFRNR